MRLLTEGCEVLPRTREPSCTRRPPPNSFLWQTALRGTSMTMDTGHGALASPWLFSALPRYDDAAEAFYLLTGYP